MPDNPFKEWCILELMGHRRLAGRIEEVQIGGASFLRLDVPNSVDDGDHWGTTQFYSPAAVYCLTPTTEAVARRVAVENQPTPVYAWELKPLAEAHTEITHSHLCRNCNDEFGCDCQIPGEDGLCLTCIHEGI